MTARDYSANDGWQDPFAKSEHLQAWLHYRQNETLRMQYMQHWLTAMLASVAASAFLFGRDGPTGLYQPIIFSLFLFLLFIFCFYTAASVSRIGQSLDFYFDLIELGHRSFLQSVRLRRGWSYDRLRKRSPHQYLLTLQGAALGLVFTMMALLIAVDAALLGRWAIGPIRLWSVVGTLLSLLHGAILLVEVLLLGLFRPELARLLKRRPPIKRSAEPLPAEAGPESDIRETVPS